MFFDGPTHLYKRVCPSVRRSDGWSDGRSVTSSFFGLLGATNAVYTALFIYNARNWTFASELNSKAQLESFFWDISNASNLRGFILILLWRIERKKKHYYLFSRSFPFQCRGMSVVRGVNGVLWGLNGEEKEKRRESKHGRGPKCSF